MKMLFSVMLLALVLAYHTMASAGLNPDPDGGGYTFHGPETAGDFNADGYTDRLRYRETMTEDFEPLDHGIYLWDGACQCEAGELIDAYDATDILYLETPQGDVITFEEGTPPLAGNPRDFGAEQPRHREWWWLEDGDWTEGEAPSDNCSGISYGEFCFAEEETIEVDALLPCRHYGCDYYRGEWKISLQGSEQANAEAVSVRVYNPVTGAVHATLSATVGPEVGQWNCQTGGPNCTLVSGWCEKRGPPTAADPEPWAWEWDVHVESWDGVEGISTKKQLRVLCQ